MASVESHPFVNGEACWGISHVVGDLELDVITIRGAYPESQSHFEAWARNKESHLLATAVSGVGSIATRSVVDGQLVIDRRPLDIGRGEYIPAGTWYTWESDGDEMVVAATFHPPFDPKKYEIKTEEELQDEI